MYEVTFLLNILFLVPMRYPSWRSAGASLKKILPLWPELRVSRTSSSFRPGQSGAIYRHLLMRHSTCGAMSGTEHMLHPLPPPSYFLFVSLMVCAAKLQGKVKIEECTIRPFPSASSWPHPILNSVQSHIPHFPFSTVRRSPHSTFFSSTCSFNITPSLR